MFTLVLPLCFALKCKHLYRIDPKAEGGGRTGAMSGEVEFPIPPFLPREGCQPHVLLVTLLPGSVGLSLHLLGVLNLIPVAGQQLS